MNYLIILLFNLFILCNVCVIIFCLCNYLCINFIYSCSMRHKKDAICNLQISDDPVYVLGVHFTYNIELSHKKNFFEKLRSLKRTLSVWS